MGLFGNKKEGGMMDVIRCDEQQYLIWKWSPAGEPSRRENAIRYGSSLRVKDGEVAVFVYKQKDGTMQDFIEGPFDQTIKTANFPVLTSIVGSAFGGASPFQAEIYFINLAGNVQLTFYLNNFNVADQQYPRFTVPVETKGTITFNITDYRSFIKLNRMHDFSLEDFKQQLKAAVSRYAKSVIGKAPKLLGKFVEELPTCLDEVSDLVKARLYEDLSNDFGINIKRFDFDYITLDEESENYKKLQAITSEQQAKTIAAQTDVYNAKMARVEMANAENYEESLRVQREETQRLQRLQTEMANLTAHQIDVQGDVAKTAAASIGQLGGSGGSSMDGGGGGFNPAAMMTGMMMGGAVGGSMSNMIGNMTQGVNQPQPPMPPSGALAEYHISVNGQQAGPYTIDQLKGMVTAGQMDKTTYVWKAGMAGWEQAANVGDMSPLFAAVPPPPPPATSPVPPPPPAGSVGGGNPEEIK